MGRCFWFCIRHRWQELNQTRTQGHGHGHGLGHGMKKDLACPATRHQTKYRPLIRSVFQDEARSYKFMRTLEVLQVWGRWVWMGENGLLALGCDAVWVSGPWVCVWCCIRQGCHTTLLLSVVVLLQRLPVSIYVSWRVGVRASKLNNGFNEVASSLFASSPSSSSSTPSVPAASRCSNDLQAPR